MKNFRQDGERLRYTASGAAISSGDIVVVGNRVGVAIADIADGSTGELLMDGVVEYDKVSAQEWAQGNEIYFDSSADKFTTVATGNVQAGYAHKSAANPSAKGEVRLVHGQKQSLVIADIATADGSDAATTQALANASKAKINAILAALKAAGLMKNS